jgi:hypothetical protein
MVGIRRKHIRIKIVVKIRRDSVRALVADSESAAVKEPRAFSVELKSIELRVEQCNEHERCAWSRHNKANRSVAAIPVTRSK